MASVPVTRAAVLGVVCVAAAALGVALLALAPGASRLPPGGSAVPVLTVVVGWGFTGLGAFAAWRRPDNAIGGLMTAFGLSALVSGLSISEAALPFVLSGVADALALPLFVHLLLAFPSGRLEGAASRWVVGASYAVALVPALLAVLLGATAADPGCGDCPRNPLVLEAQDGLVEAALSAHVVLGLGLAAVAIGLIARRRGPERRAFAPLALAASVLLVLVIVSVAAQALDLSDGVQQVAQLAFIACFAALPAAFLVGLRASHFFRTASVARLFDRLELGGGAAGVERALAAALGDPSLSLLFWLPERGGYVDREGHPATLPEDGATEITHQARRVGALVHARALGEDPDLMRTAAGAAGLALENDRLEVELRAQLQALRASRARIVEAGDAERRRLGRDLHDGAQSRLVSVLIDLQLLRERPDEAPELADRALANARAAIEDLRELAAGIHPAVLSQRGLDAALATLATRSPVPVELDVALQDRLPSAVETVAYFVVAEALTNVVKYAEASHARVAVRREDGHALVEIRDDGVGGADIAAGSGLRGLGDRVGALDGRIELESPRGEGTLVRARIPLRA